MKDFVVVMVILILIGGAISGIYTLFNNDARITDLEKEVARIDSLRVEQQAEAQGWRTSMSGLFEELRLEVDSLAERE